MKKLTVLFILIVMVSFGCKQAKDSTEISNVQATQQTETPTKSAYKNISSEYLMANKDAAGVVLLDVRTPQEVSQGNITGSIVIDYMNADFKTKVLELDKNAHYMVYCKGGGRSAKASEFMIENGFTNVDNLEGGYMDYETYLNDLNKK